MNGYDYLVLCEQVAIREWSIFKGKNGISRLIANYEKTTPLCDVCPHYLEKQIFNPNQAGKLTFNNQHRLESLSGRISKQIEVDSLDLLKSFKDSAFLRNKGFTKETALSMYIPNSYQIYWNTSAEAFRKKMHLEYERFWNSNRVSKAQALICFVDTRAC